MLISHRYKFIYTKTSKTAGTSVESYFEEFCMPESEWTLSHGREEYLSSAGIIGYRGPNAEGKTWYNHMPAVAIRDLVGQSTWDSYFKFCVIRNPFEKVVSAFHFFAESVDRNSLRDEFKAWIKQDGLFVTVDSDKYLIDGRICMDFFIRYESLASDMKNVCDILGVEYNLDKLPKFKSGIRPREIPMAEYYDSETIRRVEEVFAFEIANFGYSYPG